MLTFGHTENRQWPWTVILLLIRQWFKAAFLCRPALWVFTHIYFEKEILVVFALSKPTPLSNTYLLASACGCPCLKWDFLCMCMCLACIVLKYTTIYLICFKGCLMKEIYLLKCMLMGQWLFYFYHRLKKTHPYVRNYNMDIIIFTNWILE